MNAKRIAAVMLVIATLAFAADLSWKLLTYSPIGSGIDPSKPDPEMMDGADRHVKP